MALSGGSVYEENWPEGDWLLCGAECGKADIGSGE
jgi:hypothetical protein